MKFDIKDTNSKKYAVYLDGELQKDAIEADDVLGKVKVCKLSNNSWYGWGSGNKEKIKYGCVHIVVMEDYDLEEYRSKDLIKKYYEKSEEELQAGWV